MTELFGLPLIDNVPANAIATGVVVVVEYIDPDTSKQHLRLLTSDMPIWRVIGFLDTALATERAEVVAAFEADEPE